MALFIPQVGGINLAANLLAYLNASTDVKVKLYSNNLTPGWATVLGDFTESTFAGYAAVAIGDWADVGDVSSLRRKLQSAGGATWTVSGSTGLPQNVYGYYIVSTAHGLLWAERDAHAPIAVTTIGQVLTVTPNIEVGNC
jgi:hypothetical protein